VLFPNEFGLDLLSVADHHVVLPSGKLFISSVTWSDVGWYQCVAVNPIITSQRVSASHVNLLIQGLYKLVALSLMEIVLQILVSVCQLATLNYSCSKHILLLRKQSVFNVFDSHFQHSEQVNVFWCTAILLAFYSHCTEKPVFISRYHQLRTGGLRWSTVLLPLVISAGRLRTVLLSCVTCIVSVYRTTTTTPI